MDAANYLCDVLEMNYREALRYVKKYPSLNKEEILMNYCNGL
jgi:hypothetical protein